MKWPSWAQSYDRRGMAAQEDVYQDETFAPDWCGGWCCWASKHLIFDTVVVFVFAGCWRFQRGTSFDVCCLELREDVILDLEREGIPGRGQLTVSGRSGDRVRAPATGSRCQLAPCPENVGGRRQAPQPLSPPYHYFTAPHGRLNSDRR